MTHVKAILALAFVLLVGFYLIGGIAPIVADVTVDPTSRQIMAQDISDARQKAVAGGSEAATQVGLGLSATLKAVGRPLGTFGFFVVLAAVLYLLWRYWPRIWAYARHRGAPPAAPGGPTP